MADNNRVNSNFFQIAKTDIHDDVWGINVAVANLQVTGGTAGQVLSTDGLGNLSWTTGGGGTQQPLVEFAATVAGASQTFTNSTLSTFTNNTYASVYINGVLLRSSEYTIVGTTLTVSTWLNIGDLVTVGATGAGGSGGGGSGTVTSVATSGTGLGFTLTGGPITSTGTVTLTTPSDTALRTTLNIGNVANTNYSGNAQQVLDGTGAWVAAATGTVTSIATSGSGLGFSLGGGPITTTGTATLTVPTAATLRTNLSIGNVANLDLDGNVANSLRGDGTWSAAGGGSTTPGGSNTQIQFNDGGTFAGANIRFNKTLDSFTMGGNTSIGAADSAMALGTNSVANVMWAIAIGQGAQSISGIGDAAFGAIAKASGGASLALGFLSIANGGPSIAIGNESTATAIEAVAIGPAANASATSSIALGANTRANFANSMALGYSADALAVGAVAIGPGAQGTVANTIVLGTNVYNVDIPGTTTPANVIFSDFQESVTGFINTGTGITPDFNGATIFQYTANSNFTFNGFTNAAAGKSATIIIKQDAVGGRVMTSTMLFSGGIKTLSTTPLATDIIYVFYSGTTYYASLVTGYA